MASKNKQTSKQKPSRFRSGFFSSIRKVQLSAKYILLHTQVQLLLCRHIALTRRRVDEKKIKRNKRMNKEYKEINKYIKCICPIRSDHPHDQAV